MNRNAAEILEDARQLPPQDFDWLMGELLNAEGGSSEAEIEASWKTEVERRVAEDEIGLGVSCSWEEVAAPLRAQLAQ